jgi:outer membrane protein OmpA-like peptidoglycan-associated protein
MKKLLACSLLVACASSAMAETYDLSNRIGIGGGYGYTFPVLGNRFDDKAQEDFTWNGHARIQSSAANAWQFQYSALNFKRTRIDAEVFDITYLNRWRPVDRFTPVWGIGAGLADTERTGDGRATKLALKARMGMEYMLTRDLMGSLTADYQFINKMPWDHASHANTGEMHTITGMANLTVFFGHDKERSDSKKPAPAPVPVPADTDGDGVVDAKDKCPGTAAGAVVNNYGCVPEEKAQMEVEVFFATGKANLEGNSRASLEELAAFLKENPKTTVQIQGHTDNTGSDKLNKGLSQKRADAVKGYLVEQLGVEPMRLSSYGYGEDRPVADNTTTEGREKNRRVMAEISEK